MNHFDAVMEPTESLPAAEREMIAVAVSMANACSYCLVAHGYSKEFEIERLYRDNPLLLIGEGTNEIQKLIIARGLLRRHAL
jgi:alkylation response protein AidB-like acyl-CoA dehydrogenase